MLIFGVRGRVTTLDRGQFYCPRCLGDRAYTRTTARNWFTLFFVPVLPIGRPQTSLVRCDVCGGTFADGVLTLPMADAFDALCASALRRCAVAVLKAGDPASLLARSTALSVLNDAPGATGPPVDDALDDELARVSPTEVATYASPVADRLGPTASEEFFGACARVALADGPLVQSERDALGDLGARLHLSPATQLGVLELLRAPTERAAGGPLASG
ncbi:MAG TPA: zinc ribbon domain-containing protein [Acidimicrobiales bacterium]|nr:zinc ribbon domain-containing protein [Acidimicrobiales bacterium]